MHATINNKEIIIHKLLMVTEHYCTCYSILQYSFHVKQYIDFSTT